nr:MAG TPA: hypothetical protein [Caudoviricetes sp.]
MGIDVCYYYMNQRCVYVSSNSNDTHSARNLFIMIKMYPVISKQ